MGFIIWYKVEILEAPAGGGLLAAVASLIGGGLPVKVSNDLFSGQYILDADITIRMKEGANADEFAVVLPNLPADVVNTIKSKHSEVISKKDGKPLECKIYLGYFEDVPLFTAHDPVMTGAVTFLKVTVNDKGLLQTEIRGQELGGYQLRTYCDFSGCPTEGSVNPDELVKCIAQKAGLDGVQGSISNGKPWTDFTAKSENGLLLLGEIARRAESPLVIRDKKIFLGQAVGQEKGPDLSVDKNIVRLDQAAYAAEIPEICGRREDGKVKQEPLSLVQLQILGEPKLKVGQTVKVEAPDIPAGPLRTAVVEHRFSSDSGYTCELTLVAADPGKSARPPGGLVRAVDRIWDLAESVQNQKPAIDVGEIVEYEPGSQGKHLVTLNYGQSPPPDAVVPSVETPVDDKIKLHHRPIASPFAWHKCGLILPNYKKMRVLLAHNRSLINDAVVSGCLWSEKPAFDRPQNEPGDYWLCLPTELGADDLPTGKGVNDLIDKTGHRVIQVKSLHIKVGTEALPDIGSRPTPLEDETILIEHASGAKITIGSDGSIKLESANKDLILSNGVVNLKLSGPGLEVS
jgi:hypothetical protein